jgi:hypothetical protein
MQKFRCFISIVATLILWSPGVLGQNPDPAGLQRAIEVHQRHADQIMQVRGVVGAAIGLNPAGRPTIVVYTDKGQPPIVPARFDGIPVSVRVVGTIRALRNPCSGPKASRPPECIDDPGDPAIDPAARFDRPVPIGVSTGHPAVTAGTIAARVLMGNLVLALSNNQIYADEAGCNFGDEIQQPGRLDGGQSPGDAIGTLYDFEPIIFSANAANRIDAALALTDLSTFVNASPADGYGIPR